ncbi:hypothetical protein R3W88_020456 [Solanum pinnatisectum]|uniref:Uncharacterized protein n=1 Tax=Solanum pinnatisectum TaxID=50273 RepID=A0AAV9KME2_9SOLN|nr:hypothetical protein R3W88_020456 [Solanum pinnatisectum]
MPGKHGKKRKKEKGIEMSYNTCHNKGHDKRKCRFGAPASGTSFTAGPSSRPAAGPSSRPPSGPSSIPRLHQHQHKLPALVASKTRMVGMSVLHTQSGATIINPGVPSERFRNVKSSAFVTGDLGHKPNVWCAMERKTNYDLKST